MKGDFLVNLFIIIVLISILSISIDNIADTRQDIGYMKLTSSINKSSDAALQTVLASNSISANEKDIELELVKEIFFDVLSKNYDISSSEKTKSYLYQIVPLLVLVVDDGLYIAASDVVDIDGNKKFTMLWSPKFPFSYEDENYIYSLSLSDKEGSIGSINKNDGSKKYDIKPNLTKSEKVRIINNKIKDVVNEHISTSKVLNEKLYFNLALDDNLSTNPIKSESIIALVDNFDLSTPIPINKFSVASSELADVRLIVGFEKDGKLYYIPEKYYSFGADEATIVDRFSSMEEAAKEGYMPYE